MANYIFIIHPDLDCYKWIQLWITHTHNIYACASYELAHKKCWKINYVGKMLSSMLSSNTDINNNEILIEIVVGVTFISSMCTLVFTFAFVHICWVCVMICMCLCVERKNNFSYHRNRELIWFYYLKKKKCLINKINKVSVSSIFMRLLIKMSHRHSINSINSKRNGERAEWRENEEKQISESSVNDESSSSIYSIEVNRTACCIWTVRSKNRTVFFAFFNNNKSFTIWIFYFDCPI